MAKNDQDLTEEEFDRLFGGDEDKEGDNKDTEEDKDQDEEKVTLTRTQLDRLNAQGKKWRTRARGKDEDWNAQQRELTGQKKVEDAAGKGDDETKVNADEIRAQFEAEYKSKSDHDRVRTEAATALVAAGLALPEDKAARKRMLSRAMRALDTEDLVLEKSGDVDGLDEAIDKLKEDMPSLFTGQNGDGAGKKTRHGRRAPDGEDSSGMGAKDPLELLAGKIFGS